MRYKNIVKFWILLGAVLVFFQIFIGGVTRITGSGLSITKWEIVTGTLPPITEKAWLEAFDLYKETPQYEKINAGMDLPDFKFIYFWEYFHRLWARMMGFVFLFPFLFFLFKRWIDPWMIKQLSLVILFAGLAAVFGWIMVASGLVERPWVNAYKLSLHLGIALITYALLVWASFRGFSQERYSIDQKYFHSRVKMFLLFLIIQIFFGAILSGMRAALYYPTWPDIGGSFIPDILYDLSSWNLSNIIEYDKDPFMPALIHVLHRIWGYFVYIFGMILVYKIFKYPLRKRFYYSSFILLALLNLQVVLGILTLLNATLKIPVFFAVMHQAVAILLLTICLYLLYIFKVRNVN